MYILITDNISHLIHILAVLGIVTISTYIIIIIWFYLINLYHMCLHLLFVTQSHQQITFGTAMTTCLGGKFADDTQQAFCGLIMKES